MERVVLLCGAGSCGCPTVEVTQNEVTIGEVGNLVKLTTEQWNLLVDKVKAGELTSICGCGCGGSVCSVALD